MLTDFQNSFIGRLTGKFATNSYLNIPPHLKRVATLPCVDLHMVQLMPLPLIVSCFSKIQIGFTFLVPAHLGSPGQRPIKRVCANRAESCRKLMHRVRLECSRILSGRHSTVSGVFCKFKKDGPSRRHIKYTFTHHDF